MWQKENINELAENSLQDEYIKIIKSAQKGKDSNIYLYFQIMFMVTIVVVSFALKYGNNETFQFAKDNYTQIFEKDNFSESTFSYKAIMDKMVTYSISQIGLRRKAITMFKIATPSNNICMIFTNLFFIYIKTTFIIIPVPSVLQSAIPTQNTYNSFPMTVSLP